MYKVALIGGFGLGNFGDDWLLERALDIFLAKFKSEDLCIVAPNNNFDKKHYRNVIVVDHADLVVARNRVYAGGTQFYHYSSKEGTDIRKSFKKPSFFSFNASFITKRIVNKFRKDYYWNIGMGPFEQSDGQEYLNRKASQISRAKFASFRDTYSQQYVQGDSILGADICWSVEMKDTEESCEYKYDIILILRSWAHRVGFSREDAQRSVDNLRRQGKSVAVIFFSKLRDDMEIEGVDNFFWEFQNQDFDAHLKNMVSILWLGRLVVSARYHGLILAALLRLPRVASFNIDPKLRNLSETLDFSIVNDYSDVEGISELLNTDNNFLDYSEKVKYLKNRSLLVEQKLLAAL